MDKLKAGDILVKEDIRVLITEIYLFSVANNGNFQPVTLYNWQNTETDERVRNTLTFNTSWEGWEKET